MPHKRASSSCEITRSASRSLAGGSRGIDGGARSKSISKSPSSSIPSIQRPAWGAAALSQDRLPRQSHQPIRPVHAHHHHRHHHRRGSKATVATTAASPQGGVESADTADESKGNLLPHLTAVSDATTAHAPSSSLVRRDTSPPPRMPPTVTTIAHHRRSKSSGCRTRGGIDAVMMEREKERLLARRENERIMKRRDLRKMVEDEEKEQRRAEIYAINSLMRMAYHHHFARYEQGRRASEELEEGPTMAKDSPCIGTNSTTSIALGGEQEHQPQAGEECSSPPLDATNQPTEAPLEAKDEEEDESQQLVEQLRATMSV